MIDNQQLSAVTLILAGAVILIASLWLFQRTVTCYRKLNLEHQPTLLMLFRTHSALMGFFIASYLLVCYRLLIAEPNTNALIVGIVFFAGAVFVLLSVIVQSKMLESVSHQIDKTDHLTGVLADEQSRVAEVMYELDHESSQLRQAESDRTEIEQRFDRIKQYELLGQLSSSIAHDVNNQLGPIVAFPEILLSSLPEGFKHRHLLQQMHDSGLTISSIINNLLSLSNRNTVLHEKLSVNMVIDQFFESEDYRRTCEMSATNQVTWQLASDIHAIRASAESLHRLVNNLVSNALEASEPQSPIQLATRNEYVDQTKQLSHDSLPPGDYVVLNVTDHGRGMAPEQMSMLFQPFQTSKTFTNDGIVGLGLICVRAIVDDHNAKLNVHSEHGTGTAIDVYFHSTDTPTDGVPSPFANLTEPARLPRDSAAHVLVVDDMKTQRQLAQTLLAHLGCDTVAVTSGQEALDILKSSTFDVVLLDMRLGEGMDGLVSLQKIKAIAPTIHVIIASGYSKNDRVREAVKLGAHFLKKPYHLERLERALQQYRSDAQSRS